MVGGSAGTALAAAVKYAERLPQGSNIVVMLPDTGRNYLTKIFSDDWMFENGFLDNAPERISVGEILNAKGRMPSLLSIDFNDSVINAASLMKEHEISQLPVLKNGEVVGGLSEITLIKLLYDGVNLESTSVAAVMTTALPQLDESVDIYELYRLLMAGYGGIIVTKNNRAHGFLAKMDFADFWINKLAKKEAIEI